MTMDRSNPVIQLCIAGTRAEYEHRLEAARGLYWRAWETARDDYEACIAAHYVARLQETPGQTLHWNREALSRAEAAGDERVEAFYVSLYLNLGQSYEALGDLEQAQMYYELARGSQ